MVILLIILVLLLAGGGYGWHAGYVGGPAGFANPVGVILLVLLILLLVRAFGLYY